VLTGHDEGLITLNLGEADPVTRERVRTSLHERYRTLLGHFRHEIGHYYFDRLVIERNHADAFRALFGDERQDYGESLQKHYGSSSLGEFQDSYISAYSTAHPWEDWAETFAHYLHMCDTLETAHHYGLASVAPARASLPGVSDFDVLYDEWHELTIALNSLNRSMGLPDAYPFAVAPKVREKIEFVHRLVREAQAPTGRARGDDKPVTPQIAHVQ
jgi:hypothetical protein